MLIEHKKETETKCRKKDNNKNETKKKYYVFVVYGWINAFWHSQNFQYLPYPFI